MSSDPTGGKLSMSDLCSVVESAIKAATSKDELSAPISAESQMGTPSEWDSLSFVVVFTTVGDAFDVELDDDDAIHFTSISTMYAFLNDLMSI